MPSFSSQRAYTAHQRLLERDCGLIGGRRLPQLFKQHAMIDISITPQTIILSYPFAELRKVGYAAPSARLKSQGCENCSR